jgi:hypothetical protein
MFCVSGRSDGSVSQYSVSTTHLALHPRVDMSQSSGEVLQPTKCIKVLRPTSQIKIFILAERPSSVTTVCPTKSEHFEEPVIRVIYWLRPAGQPSGPQGIT